MRKLVVFVVLMLALGFATYTSTSAHAASVKFSKNIQIKLSVDCSHLPTSKKGLAALSQHNLCGLGKASSQVSPKTSIAGNCGNLSLNLYDDGGGVMLTQVSVTSYWYLGPIYRLFGLAVGTTLIQDQEAQWEMLFLVQDTRAPLIPTIIPIMDPLLVLSIMPKIRLYLAFPVQADHLWELVFTSNTMKEALEILTSSLI